MKEDTKKTVAFRDLGSMDYQEAWTYQENLFADIVAKKIQTVVWPQILDDVGKEWGQGVIDGIIE